MNANCISSDDCIKFSSQKYAKKSKKGKDNQKRKKVIVAAAVCTSIVLSSITAVNAISVRQTQSIQESNASIALSTNISYIKELDYGVDVVYDDSKLATYEAVKSEGEKGTQLVTYRAIFADISKPNAPFVSKKVVKKPKNKIIVKGTKEIITTGKFIWPIPYTHRVESCFEYRWGYFHDGIDISDRGIYGQNIIASDGGTVEFSGDDNSGYGYYVIINHNNGFKTFYAHCSELAVHTGQQVKQGQLIGYAGSTGASTGSHLHFEIRKNDTPINPLDFVN